MSNWLNLILTWFTIVLNFSVVIAVTLFLLIFLFALTTNTLVWVRSKVIGKCPCWLVGHKWIKVLTFRNNPPFCEKHNEYHQAEALKDHPVRVVEQKSEFSKRPTKIIRFSTRVPNSIEHMPESQQLEFLQQVGNGFALVVLEEIPDYLANVENGRPSCVRQAHFVSYYLQLDKYPSLTAKSDLLPFVIALSNQSDALAAQINFHLERIII